MLTFFLLYVSGIIITFVILSYQYSRNNMDSEEMAMWLVLEPLFWPLHWCWRLFIIYAEWLNNQRK